MVRAKELRCPGSYIEINDFSTMSGQTTSLQEGVTSDNIRSATDVQILDQPGLRCVPFSVTMSSSALQGLDEPQSTARRVSALVGNNGVVGTILFLQNSIIVWVGWGKVDSKTANSPNDSVVEKTSVVGSGKCHHENLSFFT